MRGMMVFSLADPAQPTLLGSTGIALSAWNLQAVGEHVYVAGGPNGLQVFDVSDPANPTQVGAYTEARASSLYVTGGYAYIAAATGGLQILSIADPSNPTLVGSYPSKGIYDVYVAASDPPGHTYAYLADWDGLRILAVDDPVNPTQVGFNGDIRNFGLVRVVSGSAPGQTYAYASEASSWIGGRLYIFAVSDPTQPSLAGIRQAFTIRIGRVQAAAGFAYVADRDMGLSVVSLADPEKPDLVRVHAMPRGESFDVHVVTDDPAGHPYAYLAENTPPFPVNGYLRIFSLADPANPVQVGVYHKGDAWFRNVCARGNYAYVITGDDNTLRVLSVADKAHPVEIGVLAGLPYVQQMHVQGNYLYLVSSSDGLLIVSVADPHNPVKVSQYTPLDTAWGIHVVGEIAYLATNFGLEFVDVSNPAPPVGRGHFATATQVTGVHVVENYAYIANRGDGLRLIYIADLAQPSELDAYSVGMANGVYAADGYIYVTDQLNGLIVLRLVTALP